MNAYTLPTRPTTAGIACLTIVAAIEAVAGGGATALLADLALIATVVAAAERRHAAMLTAAGIACGLVACGAMLMPLAIGIAVQRRVGSATMLLIPAAAATWLALDGPTLSGADATIGLWAIVPAAHLHGLLIAIAIGTLAWLTAALTARPLPGAALASAAAIAALGFALVMPQVSMAVPVALTMLVGDRRALALAGGAALLAMLAQPLIATLALAAALARVARPFLRPAANDNPVLAATRRPRPPSPLALLPSRR